MKTVTLGRTGITVSKNGFGALPIQRITRDEAAKLLRKAYDGGITLFDTARAYSDSEEKIGYAMSDIRNHIYITTKTAAQNAEEFWKDLETSLRLLKTDYNAWGVALIIMLYLLPEKKQKLLLMGCWMTVFMLIWHGWNGRTMIWMSKNGYGLILQWIGGMFAVPLLACYQGMRGRKCRWLFYVFYPAHLWILYLFRCLI